MASPCGLAAMHEWVILANLFLLLMGFAILSRHFEKSRIPDAMPAFLPDGLSGGLVLLVTVFVMSGFLDNIAAALIGGTMARHELIAMLVLLIIAGHETTVNLIGSPEC